MTFSPSDGACQKATRACPCGWRGHPRKSCVCAPAQVGRYLSRLSGPLMDRIDLQVETPSVAFGDRAAEKSTGESSAGVRRRVTAAGRKAALSARALDRVLRVARTIADLSKQDAVGASAVLEAASLRGLDRLRSSLEAVA